MSTGRARDRGMTLPELLIAVTVFGLIIAVLSSAVIVTLKQDSSSEGRLNVARAEQQIGLWLPGDLASAAAVSVDADATPCGQYEEDNDWVVTNEPCPDLGLPPGSNALLVGWSVMDASGNYTYTNVSYYFYEEPDGSFTLSRIECVNSGSGWTCTVMKVLRDLPGPPGNALWEPGTTRPDWVIQVSNPLKANAVDVNDIDTEGIKNAKRVVVTVNGGGSSDGAGGGSNQISITAGGTYRNEISGASLQGAPSFTEARSRCGGPMTLVVDESNSIGNPNVTPPGSQANIDNVKNGVREFVTALIGTPVQLQVIGFHTTSHALGTTEWQKYYDMTNQTQVNELLASIDTLNFVWTGTNGGTNWEEGLFRTFFTTSGTTAPVIPETVVFFTDGVPTFDRTVHRTGDLPADPPAPGPGWPLSTGSAYSQVAFNRANFIATWARSSVNLIGVAVGGGLTGSSPWIQDPGAGFHWVRGYREYQRAQFQSSRDFEKATGFQSTRDFEKVTTYQSTRDFERATGFQSTRDFETLIFESQRNFQVRNNPSSGWRSATPTEYYVGWASNTSNRRIPGGSPTRSWYTVTEAEYNAYRTLDGASASWRNTTWVDTTPTDFYTNQPEKPSRYRNTTTRTAYSVTEAEYDAYSSFFPSNWSISGWSDTTPTDFYTNQPSKPTKYRNTTTRTAYSVTEAEYDAYSSLFPSNWSMVWGDTTPTDFYTNQPSKPTKYRNTTTRTAYSVTEAEYDAYSSLFPSNWSISGWSDIGPSQYYAEQPAAPAKYRINGAARTWYTITPAEYKLYNTTTNDTDGYRVNTASWTWITKAEYDANNTLSGDTDGWRDAGSPEYVSIASAMDLEIQTRTSSSWPTDFPDQYDRVFAAPFRAYAAPNTSTVANSAIIGRLISGGDNYVPAIVEGGKYTNVKTANLYMPSDWSLLPGALKAIALGECGGTLTLQTKLNGAAANDPFTYQNSRQVSASGEVLTITPQVVRTNRQFTTGTFDLDIQDGLYRDVDILPENLSDLAGYSPAGWSCRAGNQARSFTVIDIPGAESSPWKGIRVRVSANEAVSCTQAVTR